MSKRFKDDYEDYYYEKDYYFDEKAYERRLEALYKNEMLVESYESFKISCAWYIGQRALKIFLNQKIKKGDFLALLYKSFLDIENDNINAKKYRNTAYHDYKDHYYRSKHEKIQEIIRVIYNYNLEFPEDKIIYGYQKSDVREVSYILYIELPDCPENFCQISYHTDIKNLSMVPRYDKEWDGKVSTTLQKLEKAIITRYKDELIEKYKVDMSVGKTRKRIEYEEEKRRIQEELRIAEEKRKEEQRKADEERRRLAEEKHQQEIKEMNDKIKDFSERLMTQNSDFIKNFDKNSLDNFIDVYTSYKHIDNGSANVIKKMMEYEKLSSRENAYNLRDYICQSDSRKIFWDDGKSYLKFKDFDMICLPVKLGKSQKKSSQKVTNEVAKEVVSISTIIDKFLLTAAEYILHNIN